MSYTDTTWIDRLEETKRERNAAREEASTLRARVARLEEALREARLQIEYLHEKFQETGSGNGVLARIDNALGEK